MFAKASEDGTAPVDILTDAKHCTRKNSRKTDFICIGYNTKRVISYKTVTSEDDQIAQRHEKLGTVDIYSTLGSDNFAVQKYSHD